MKATFALAAAITCFFAAPAFSQNAYSRDGSSCDLNSRTRLSELCPNGMGMPTYGSQADLIANNPNIAAMIVQASQEYGVDPNLALAVSGHEGAMSACAGSFSGVQGPMQLTQGTGRLFGMDRGVLSDNIRGGVLTLRDAVRRCGGTSDMRCIANIYNGSTESQRQQWTRDVQNRYAQMQNGNATAPPPCGQQSQAQCDPTPGTTGPGDFPTTPTPVSSAAPSPASTDINVGANQI